MQSCAMAWSTGPLSSMAGANGRSIGLEGGGACASVEWILDTARAWTSGTGRDVSVGIDRMRDARVGESCWNGSEIRCL